MKIIKGSALVTVGISALYLMMAAALSFTEVSLRSWVNVLGQMVVELFMPLMLLVWALAVLYQNARVHQVVKVGCIAASVIVGGVYAFWIFFFILFRVEEERMLTAHLLVTDESLLLEENPVYYRPVAVFFKKPTEITMMDRLEYLEDRYRRDFEVSPSGRFIYDAALPEIQVVVRSVGMSLMDDYMEEVTLYSLLQVYDTVEMERSYHTVRGEKDWRKYLCLEASGYDDIPELAEDISCLSAGVLSGGFVPSADMAALYEEYAGSVYFSFGESQEGYSGHISFGGPRGEWPIAVEDLVRIAYSEKGVGKQEAAWKPSEDTAASGSTETAPEAETMPEQDVETDYREEAAKTVYDAVLAEEGFSYEVCYNAKGNLYIALGSKTEENTGQTYSYQLVYDRTSKNGACELLVLYRSKDGWDSEGIVDMYAVETATGKVVVSGKKVWSDVGTREYREMTGE